MTETEHAMIKLRLENVEHMLKCLHEDLEAIKEVMKDDDAD